MLGYFNFRVMWYFYLPMINSLIIEKYSLLLGKNGSLKVYFSRSTLYEGRNYQKRKENKNPEALCYF